MRLGLVQLNLKAQGALCSVMSRRDGWFANSEIVRVYADIQCRNPHSEVTLATSVSGVSMLRLRQMLVSLYSVVIREMLGYTNRDRILIHCSELSRSDFCSQKFQSNVVIEDYNVVI